MSEEDRLRRMPLFMVDLRPFRRRDGRLVDPVDPQAAALVPEDACRDLGLVVYARTAEAVYAAALWPPSPSAVAVLEALHRPVRLGRIDAPILRAVHDRLWPRRERARIGELLAHDGKVTPEGLVAALRVQSAQGGRLGAHLVADQSVTHWDVAQAVARQHRLPLVDLATGRLPGMTAELFALADESFWRDHLCVPLTARPGRLLVAMVDPDDSAALAELGSRTGLRVQRAVTGYRDVLRVLEDHYRSRRVEDSVEGLRRDRPDDSASVTLSGGQRTVAIVGLFALAVLVARWPWSTLAGVAGAFQVLYLAIIAFRLSLLLRGGADGVEVEVSREEVEALDETSLPAYSVLVPAYREASILPILTEALGRLDYPKDRLEVKLLLEADDVETIEAARASRLPAYIDIVVVPASAPQTKPKACNYGLLQCRGAYVVIFDAEDVPEPDQLKKAVAAFRKAPQNIACIQAKLSYFNAEQNILTRWFTAEYAMWFDVLLPALTTHRMPIPLGGTSNHFRADVLREVGMWDPHNVAEDADLGIRLHKLGYRTAVVDSTTFEEANSEFVNWVRQRSRWTKGYMQTWLVHMRHPILLWRELGGRAFVGFQLTIGGNPATQLINPLLWAVTSAWFLTYWVPIQHVFPTWVYMVSMFDLAVGNFLFTYLNLVGLVRRRAWTLVPVNLAAPLYWTMMSVAAWKALLQMVVRPSFWEKTEHGLTDFVPRSAEAGVDG